MKAKAGPARAASFAPSLSQNILFSVLIAGLGVFASSFGSVADYVAGAFGQPAEMAGVYLSVYGAGSCLSAFFGGSLADRLGKRRVIAVALGLLILGLVTAALSGGAAGATGAALTFAGLFLAGVGFGPSEAMGSALLTDENPDNATRWMNISQIGFGIGAIGAPIAAVWYCTSGGGSYRGVFLFCAALFLALLAVIVATGRGRPVRVNAQSGVNSFALLKNPRFLLLALMVFFYLGYESVAPITFKQLLLRQGAGDGLAALSISLFWGSMLACRLIGVFMNGKELFCIKLFTLFVLAGIALLLTATSDAVLLAGVVLYGFGCGPVWPMLFVLAARLFPDRSGAAYGVMMLFSTASNSLFPALIGTGVGDARVTFMVCAVLAGLVLVGAGLASRGGGAAARRKRPRPARERGPWPSSDRNVQ